MDINELMGTAPKAEEVKTQEVKPVAAAAVSTGNMLLDIFADDAALDEALKGGDYAALPEGTYTVKVKSSEIKLSKNSGNPMGQTVFEIIDGNFTKRTILTNDVFAVNGVLNARGFGNFANLIKIVTGKTEDESKALTKQLVKKFVAEGQIDLPLEFALDKVGVMELKNWSSVDKISGITKSGTNNTFKAS